MLLLDVHAEDMDLFAQKEVGNAEADSCMNSVNKIEQELEDVDFSP